MPMSNRNVKIVLFCISVYIVIMTMTVFWIIPNLVSMFKLAVIGVLVLSMGAAVINSILIARLMMYLESRDIIIKKRV